MMKRNFQNLTAPAFFVIAGVAIAACLAPLAELTVGQTAPIQPTPAPATSLPFSVAQFDAAIVRDTGWIRYMGSDRTPFAKALAVRQAFAAAKPGDLILIGAGQFDFGNATNLLFPDQCTVRGLGREITFLLSEVISDTAGTSFALQNTIVEDLSLKNDCWYFAEDGRCVGFDSNGPTGAGFTATIRRCNCWSRDWTIYNWRPHNKLLVDDCDVTTGRVGVACEDSGDGQDVEVRRSRIYGDASLSQSRGETSNEANGGVFGFIARGGPLKIIDCEVQIKGKASAYPSYTPRACAITDQGGGGDQPAGNTIISVWNLRSKVDPNGADPARCLDVDLHFVGTPAYAAYPAAIKISSGCWGSAADGTLTKSSN
jgi:hypothetical protein